MPGRREGEGCSDQNLDESKPSGGEALGVMGEPWVGDLRDHGKGGCEDGSWVQDPNKLGACLLLELVRSTIKVSNMCNMYSIEYRMYCVHELDVLLDPEAEVGCNGIFL